MGYLHYPRKQTSVSYAAETDVIVCYGGAKPTDKHLTLPCIALMTRLADLQLASVIHCIGSAAKQKPLQPARGPPPWRPAHLARWQVILLPSPQISAEPLR
jgi:hypothetical protein